MPTVELKTPWRSKEAPKNHNRNQEREGVDLVLKINPEFAKMIPPLTYSEKYRLEKSLKLEGCRDPLVIWNGTLIDGHNRYKYCKEKGIAFRVIERHFADEDSARLWMIENQMARRNLNKTATLLLEDERTKIIARQNKKRQLRKPIDKESVGLISGQQNKDDSSGRTNRQVSAITGIGHDTVSKFNYIQKHAEDFDEGDLIRQMCEETVDDENRKMTIARAYNKIKQKERQEELRHKGFPINKYEVLYVDPGDTSIELIKKYPVNHMARKASVLFLWSCDDKLGASIDLVEQWGFEYSTVLVWDFVRPHKWDYGKFTLEFLIVGRTEGWVGAIPDQHGVLKAFFRKERISDSRYRPEEYKEMIHKLYPDSIKVDLFGDTQSEGWDVYTPDENAQKLLGVS